PGVVLGAALDPIADHAVVRTGGGRGIAQRGIMIDPVDDGHLRLEVHSVETRPTRDVEYRGLTAQMLGDDLHHPGVDLALEVLARQVVDTEPPPPHAGMLRDVGSTAPEV